MGFFATRRGIITEGSRKVLSQLMLKVTFPCLGFHAMLTGVDPSLLSQNLLSVGMGMAILTIGLLVGYIAVIPCRIQGPTRNTFVHLISTCNYIFLPLPIVMAIWPQQQGTMFLHTLGCSLVYWVVGIYPLSRSQGWRVLIKNIFNPPLVAMLAGLFIALLGGGGFLGSLGEPDPAGGFGAPALFVLVIGGLMEGIKILGSATIPLALLFVGAALATTTTKVNKALLIYYCFIRLVIFPVIFLPIVLLSGLSGEAAFIPLLISMMPASNISTMIAHRFGGDEQLASAANLWSTPLALITVPILFPILSYYL